MKAYTSQYRFDAYVVGSDQVWRPTYNLGDKLFDMYLAFADGQQVKRLSYAASFGVDKWEYSDDQTRICSELAKQFDAISVREKSGVKLCADNLGVDAIHVLDPTMLLDPSDYNKLIGKQISDKTTGGVILLYFGFISTVIANDRLCRADHRFKALHLPTARTRKHI